MLCLNYVIWKYSPKGKRSVFAAGQRYEDLLLPQQARKIPKGYTVTGIQTCGGHITAEIVTRADAGWGETYYSADIEYKCDQCGNTFFPKLPASVEGVSDWLTKYIEQLSQEVDYRKEQGV